MRSEEGLNYKQIQRVTNNTADSIINNNKHMGADSSSFSERRKIEQNRRIVRGYRNSQVYHTVMNERRSVKLYGNHRFVEKPSTENAKTTAFGSPNAPKDGPIGNTNGYKASIAARQAMADRFSGGQARPTPKTGGFGRH